jgi:hypothetical protein
MPSYTNRRPNAALLQYWIERDVAEWLDENIDKKRKGVLVSMLLASERARREERQKILADTVTKPVAMMD